MKKFICILISFVCVISLWGLINYLKCDAVFKYRDEDDRYISYNNDSYVKWTWEITNKYRDSGEIYGEYHNTSMFPYYIIEDDLRDKVYVVSDGLIYRFFSPYFSFCGDSNYFIVYQPDSFDWLYVKENFVFPNISKNEVEEIRNMYAPFDYDTISDKKLINMIVHSAKSGDELDDDIYEQLLKWCYNNRIYLKYTGYPLLEEFLLITTEDGRHMVEMSSVERREGNTADASLPSDEK